MEEGEREEELMADGVDESKEGASHNIANFSENQLAQGNADDTRAGSPRRRRSRPSGPDAKNQLNAKFTLRKFFLFKTRAKFYIFGANRNKSAWRVLTIDRREMRDPQLYADSTTYSRPEVAEMMQRIHAGNLSTGGATHVATASAIVGLIRFLKGPYLVMITNKSRLGTVCGHPVYGVADTKVVQICDHGEVDGMERKGIKSLFGEDAARGISRLARADEERMERRYFRMFCELDMSNDFFFSYTFALNNHLQANVTRKRSSLATSFESMFVWNAYLARPVVQALGREAASLWLVPLVHGFFQQMTLSLFGRIFSVTLISRRSRYFAGTRYHKRGVSDTGYVANEVETEQIVDGGWDAQNRRRISSVVQLRGSVPLFWSQESGTLYPKPGITIQRFDPFYEATKKHYERVAQRYGRPVVNLSLLKSHDLREHLLHDAFGKAIDNLNQLVPADSRMAYVHWNFSRRSRVGGDQDEVLSELCSIARGALALTGIFTCGGSKLALEPEVTAASDPASLIHSVERQWLDSHASPDYISASHPATLSSQLRQGASAEGDVQLQNGIVRTNCVDCLDRTNVAQFAIGKEALGQQLYSLGLSQTKELDSGSSLVTSLMSLYQDNGDFVALQYGGSEAHHPIIASRTRSRELLTSVRRFYSNAYTDDEKQGAINLFLGNFIPKRGQPALWELNSDYYLHVHSKAGSGNNPPEACEDVPFLRYSSEQDIKAEVERLSADDLSGTEPKLRSFDKLLASRKVLQDVRVDNKGGGTNKEQNMNVAAFQHRQRQNLAHSNKGSKDSEGSKRNSSTSSTRATSLLSRGRADFTFAEYLRRAWRLRHGPDAQSEDQREEAERELEQHNKKGAPATEIEPSPSTTLLQRRQEYEAYLECSVGGPGRGDQPEAQGPRWPSFSHRPFSHLSGL